MKGTAKKVAEIGRELNVGTVLEDSVRKEGSKLRITAQLISVDNEAHLWSEDYDRELKGVFAIQKDIADRVAGAMVARLGTTKSAPGEPKGTRNVEAYNAYLKGRFHVNKASVEGVRTGTSISKMQFTGIHPTRWPTQRSPKPTGSCRCNMTRIR